MEKQSLQPNKRQSSTKKVWSAAIIVLAVGITVGSLYWSEGKQKVASPLLSADEKLNNQNQEKIFEPVNQQSENQLKDQPDTGHLSPTNSPSNDVHSSDTKQPENQFTNEVPPQVKDDDQNQGQINSSNSAHSNPNAPATGTKSSDTSDSGVSSTSNDSSTSVTDAEKQGVIAQHRKKLTALKSSCKSSVNNLIGQAKESIKQAQKDGDEDAANSAKKRSCLSLSLVLKEAVKVRLMKLSPMPGTSFRRGTFLPVSLMRGSKSTMRPVRIATMMLWNN